MERSQEYEPLILDLQKSQVVPTSKRYWLVSFLVLLVAGTVISAVTGVQYLRSRSNGQPGPEPTVVVNNTSHTPLPSGTPVTVVGTEPSPLSTMAISQTTPVNTTPAIATPGVPPVSSPTPSKPMVKPTPTASTLKPTPTRAPIEPTPIPTPVVGFLNLDSAPQHAEVRIDGQLIGYTPIERYALKPGTYTIKFVYDGKIAEHKLTINAGKTSKYDYSFDGFATLVIRTIPRECDILLNGELAGQSPLTKEGLLPGTYTITARKAGYTSAEKTVTVKQGEQPGDIVFMLKRRDIGTEPEVTAPPARTPRVLHPSERTQ